MNILIATDKFKGTLTAEEACLAIDRGLRRNFQGKLETNLCPVADGGEGTAATICAARGGTWQEIDTLDPLSRPIQAGYGLFSDGKHKTAVMEMSAASGLWLVSGQDRNPELASTFGTGLLMRHAIGAGVDRLVIGIGGSATNDGGVGVAQALGFRFFDDDGSPISELPRCILQAQRIYRPSNTDFPDILVACDVENPLLGVRGATEIYGPQKGIYPEEICFYEERMEHLADLVKSELGADYRNVPGAGAAGGLGFGLMSFCDGELKPGFELVSSVIGLEERVGWADIVITGEGSIDRQTLEGKAPAGVARLARMQGKPVIGIAGIAERKDPEVLGMFDGIVELVSEEISSEMALSRSAEVLEKRCSCVVDLIKALTSV